jgi:hypothetical protein
LTLKELMNTNPRSARRLFKEPMCNCGDWGLIRVGQPWPPPPPGTNPAGTTGTSTGATPPGGRQTRPGAPLPGSYSSPPPGSGNPGNGNGDTSGGLNFGSPKETNNAPIIGVYSKVHKKGLRTFHGQEYYDQWGFIAGANNDPELPGSLPAGFPGIPNRPPGLNKPPRTSPGTSSGSNF